MKRPTALAIALIVGAAVLAPGSAGATHFPHTRCDPSGDTCVSVKKINGVRLLRLGMLFKYFKKHEVCVKGPGEPRTCNNYRSRRLSSGLWGSSVDWREHYPFLGPGLYRVAWRAQGHAVGWLKFHVG
jgi:hypothetical protein